MSLFQQKLRTTALKASAAIAFVEVTTHLPSEGRSSLAYHRLFDDILTPLGRRLFNPEDAHNIALEVVRRGLAPRLSREGEGNGKVGMNVEIGNGTTRRLRFAGPVGLAAGFDKNGSAIQGLFDLGFSSVEIGSVTPLPQPGNPKPRSFRLVQDRGIINRFGFNSEGAERVREHLAEFRDQYGGRGKGLSGDHDAIVNNTSDGSEGDDMTNKVWWALGWVWKKLAVSTPRTGVLGVNLGKNKLSTDEVGDYTIGIRELGPYADYLVINVSSPNTPGLRSLQRREPLQNLLSSAMNSRDEHAPHAPLFVKLAPDLTLEEMEDVATVIMDTGIDGMIVSNTTNARPEALMSNNKHETGGLSGQPIRDRSTECIRTMYKLTKGMVPIIGVGGVGSGRDAFDKLKAGASVVQTYSMMVYEGPGVVSRIRNELADIMLQNGYQSVEDVVGADQEDIYWDRREDRVHLRMKESHKNEKDIVAM